MPDEPSTPDEHHVTDTTNTADTIRWIRDHGYRVAVTGSGLGPGLCALILQPGDGQPMTIVNLPALLRWDGQRITTRDIPAALRGPGHDRT